MGIMNNMFFKFSIQSKIWEEKRKISDQALKGFMKKHIRRDIAIPCTLAQVRDSLICKDIKETAVRYNIDDFREELEVTSEGMSITMDIPQFPKESRSRGISLQIYGGEIKHRLRRESSPDDIADFIISVFAWLPEYLSIEEKIRAEEKQKEIACNLASDLLTRTVGARLEEKGYRYDFHNNEYDPIAGLTVYLGNGVEMKFEVDLMKDFMEQICKVVDTLPVFES
jgi:hypothetical protein